MLFRSTEKQGHCIFSRLDEVCNGTLMSFNEDNLACLGGKFYCGYTAMPEHVPNFVSIKEKYKKTPELVREYVEQARVPKAKDKFLNFARVDMIESFEGKEGVLFYATPDMLSGLTTWAWFDRNEDDVVCSTFASGCANVVSYAVRENRENGYRSFIGLFDLSARPYVKSNILTFTIPMSRFKVMLETMRESSLFGTHAWDKVRSEERRVGKECRL